MVTKEQMVERMARALHGRWLQSMSGITGRSDKSWEQLSENGRDEFRKDAEAALTAMEQTE